MLSEDFADEYRRFISTAPAPDNLEARRQYATRMLERAIIADEGRRLDLEQRADVRSFTLRARRMATRRSYLQRQIGATIPEPTEQDVREAFRRANMRLRLQQIFAGTAHEADSLYQLLDRGIPFDTLAARSMRSRGIDTGTVPGDMGWVSWNDMDVAPESTAFALERGEVSHPVESLVGWHIFRLLGREETVRIDANTYQGQRDRLAFEWRQRRFDEASARLVRRLVRSHELATDVNLLQQVWQVIQPAIPGSSVPPPLVMDRELSGMDPEALDRTRPVAWVNGTPFTVGQFLDALPDVPRTYWAPNLRAALEVAIRDSLLTASAEQAGHDKDPGVTVAEARALRTALYYATLMHISDTLDISRVRDSFYEEEKDRLFVAERSTGYDAWLFGDSLDARNAIRAAADNDPLVPLGTSVERRTEVSTQPRIPVAGRLPLSSPGSRTLAGPFREDSSWIVIEPLERSSRYTPKDSVDLDLYVRSSWMEIVHRAALPKEYVADDAILHEDVLSRVLPLSNP